MTVRAKLGLTVFAAGLVTALLVLVTVVYAFQRFEHETAYRRGSAFLMRVAATYDNLFEMHERAPDELRTWLRNMVLFEPDTQLYLLDLQGVVLASSGSAKLAPGFRVAIEPVLKAIGQPDAAYVMGDDPERMDADAVVAVQPVRRVMIRPDAPVAGYLYLVLHTEQLPADRWAALRMSLTRPALWLVAAVCASTTLLAALIIVSVTRPLRRLTDAVGTISTHGLADDGAAAQAAFGAIKSSGDEFGQLKSAFDMMLATLRRQWSELRRLDHFRREGVSNLSHDLRSPLTATVACLETLEARWNNPVEGADRRLIEIALRNTRNAARLVQALGDLAKLDEPEFDLRPEVVDAGELLADICLRFADRAVRQGVTLRAAEPDASAAPPVAQVDVELFERAIANLVDNALKFCPAGSAITLSARVDTDDGGARWVRVQVADTGPGIPSADLPHLFDRFYQSRQSVAPATGEGGKGLGLAIVKRIAELHGGDVGVSSTPGLGTDVVLSVPAAAS
ncbi:MAG TPA: HAMP domain-containing sensor histidine kinase [Burkholderiaceae bacterium]|nr:HAMP domain-containing sensor histidine kinase [Burkholderiaceae bacterium]